jgi:poly(3-hydroxybutyrate) depolymerase
MTRATRALLATAALLALATTACLPGADTPPIASAPAPSGCITHVGPANKIVVTGCGGGITYNVSVPTQCFQWACGLIADVHGWTMDGDIQEANDGIAAIGRSQGYIVIQPSAPGKSWNASHYPFVLDFVKLAAQVWRVDSRRIHFTGFSQGGFMTWWMRCNSGDLFASVAPVSAAGGPCTGGQPNIPTLYVQGRDDYFINSASTVKTVADMIQAEGYGPGQVTSRDPGRWSITHYTNANGDTFDTLFHSFTTSGLVGHCLMGGLQPTSIYSCDQPTSLRGSDAIVDFFKKHPKPTN